MESQFTPSEEQKKWASKSRQGAKKEILLELLKKQEGKCAISKVEMIFKPVEGRPVKGGRGCHPLYPAVDHIDPGNSNGGYQIVCYALNDLKGHLPVDCFNELMGTSAWKKLMAQWVEQAQNDRMNREAFKKLWLYVIRSG